MKKRLLSFFKYLALTIFSLYLLIWIGSPFAIHHLVKQQLSSLNLTLNQASVVRYNPFISSLSVDELVLTKGQEKVFAIDKMRLELNLLQLMFNKLSIKSFTIDGLYSKVVIEENKREIAGIVLPQSEPTPAKQQKPSEDNLAGYQLVMPEFTSINGELALTINQQQFNVMLSKIALANLYATQEKQTGELAVNLGVQQSNLSGNGTFHLVNGKGTISSQLTVNQFELAQLLPWLPKSIISLAGQLNFSGKQQLVLTAEGSNIQLDDSQLSIDNLNTSDQKLMITAQHFSNAMPAISIELPTDAAMKINGTSNMIFENVAVKNQQDVDQLLLSINNMQVDALTFETLANIAQAKINRLTVNQAVISQNQAQQLPALTTFEQLNINNIELSESNANINEVNLAGLVANIELDQNKTVANLAPIESISPKTENNEQQPPEEQPAPPTANNFHFSLATFYLIDNAKILLKDTSVDPIYQRSFTINELQLGPIDNQQAELISLVKLTGKSNEYTHYTFNGTAQPFSAQPKYALTGYLNELDLHDISSYIKDALDFEIKSGQLNLALDTKLTGDKISGNAKMKLNGIDFTAANDHEADSLKDKTAIPFTAALGMLKDGNGNVELDIPLSGKTSDPSFGLTGFMSLLVKQATMMAAKDYLLTTFVPYAKVVSIALTAGQHLLKIRFNDLIFTPEQTELPASQESFLQQFAAFMKDNSDTTITICAIATPQDIKLPSGTKVVEKSQIEQLANLSLSRMNNFKRHMVDHYQVASSQMLLCTPQIDSSKTSQPRITFANNS